MTPVDPEDSSALKGSSKAEQARSGGARNEKNSDEGRTRSKWFLVTIIFLGGIAVYVQFSFSNVYSISLDDNGPTVKTKGLETTQQHPNSTILQMSRTIDELNSKVQGQNAELIQTRKDLAKVQQEKKSSYVPAYELVDRDSFSYRSILPKKIYSVIGLESSGTKFVTKILATALGTKKPRNGPLVGPADQNYEGGTRDVWVQHLSLPWGCCCEQDRYYVRKLILPGMCATKLPQYKEHCAAMARDANITITEADFTNYKNATTNRFILDIEASKEFYASRGVEQIFVIMVRDQTIRRIGPVDHKYCQDHEILLEEEAVGTKIIERAVRKYIMEEPPPLHPSERGQQPHRGLSSTSTLPSGSNVVLVSYESLMKLGKLYIEMLYDALNIESNYIPDIKDGNLKYINTTKLN